MREGIYEFKGRNTMGRKKNNSDGKYDNKIGTCESIKNRSEGKRKVGGPRKK